MRANRLGGLFGPGESAPRGSERRGAEAASRSRLGGISMIRRRSCTGGGDAGGTLCRRSPCWGTPRAPRYHPRLVAAIALLCTLLVWAPSGPRAEDLELGSDPGQAVETLRRAFENRYALDVTERVQLVIRNQAGAKRRRVAEIAMKVIAGRLHSLGRFTEPEYLRGLSLLVIENRDRSNDHFVYLPSQQRVRRVSSAQRADAFMGTDFTYEDFERRYVEDYAVVRHGTAAIDGENVLLIAAEPHYDSAYRLTEFFVATSDFAILEVRYFRGPREEPAKILRAPRSETQIFEGHVLPTVMEMEDCVRHTVSEARFDKITVNPTLEDSLFSVSALEVGRAIPLDASESVEGRGG